MHSEPIEVLVLGELDREEHKLLKHIVNELRKNNQFTKEIRDFMSTVPAGLQALQTADQALADAITAVAKAINDAVAALQNSTAAEDATVGSVAATVGTQAKALSDLAAGLESAINPAPPVEPPPAA